MIKREERRQWYAASPLPTRCPFAAARLFRTRPPPCSQATCAHTPGRAQARDRADRVRELHVQGGAGGARFLLDQQVQRGPARPALLRRQREHRRGATDLSARLSSRARRLPPGDDGVRMLCSRAIASATTHALCPNLATAVGWRPISVGVRRRSVDVRAFAACTQPPYRPSRYTGLARTVACRRLTHHAPPRRRSRTCADSVRSPRSGWTRPRGA